MNGAGLLVTTTDSRQMRNLAVKDGQVVAADPITLLTLVLSGPLLLSVVVCYFAATLLWGIHVPKTLGVDIGYYMKLHYPSLYHSINDALLRWGEHRRPYRKHKIPVFKTYFTDTDGITIPYQFYEEYRIS
ncbi:hypothetical protein FHG87_017810 [Trinorchestia longiramus]|nr:hypothetical protein FHG87_017810 [Trinorchestia longiramus]